MKVVISLEREIERRNSKKYLKGTQAASAISKLINTLVSRGKNLVNDYNKLVSNKKLSGTYNINWKDVSNTSNEFWNSIYIDPPAEIGQCYTKIDIYSKLQRAREECKMIDTEIFAVYLHIKEDILKMEIQLRHCKSDSSKILLNRKVYDLKLFQASYSESFKNSVCKTTS